MKYTGKLNKPTSEQLASKYVVLEQQYESNGNWRDTPHEPTVSDLLSFMTKNEIPLTAKIVYHHCGSHAIALEWK